MSGDYEPSSVPETLPRRVLGWMASDESVPQQRRQASSPPVGLVWRPNSAPAAPPAEHVAEPQPERGPPRRPGLPEGKKPSRRVWTEGGEGVWSGLCRRLTSPRMDGEDRDQAGAIRSVQKRSLGGPRCRRSLPQSVKICLRRSSMDGPEAPRRPPDQVATDSPAVRRSARARAAIPAAGPQRATDADDTQGSGLVTRGKGRRRSWRSTGLSRQSRNDGAGVRASLVVIVDGAIEE
jgi:hypothetical protein